MLGTLTDKAGNAATIEEAMYDLCNVFDVAIISSLASQLYRSYLNIETFASNGIVDELANLTNLTELAAKRVEAFNAFFVAAALIGGIMMLVVSLIVYILIPKSLDITKKS